MLVDLQTNRIFALDSMVQAGANTVVMSYWGEPNSDRWRYYAPMQTATATALGMRHLVAKESEWMGNRGEIEMSFDVIPELPAPSRFQ